jgi:hypothetical protein
MSAVALFFIVLFVISVIIVANEFQDIWRFAQKKIDLLASRFYVFEDSVERKGMNGSTALYFKKYSSAVSAPIYLNVQEFQKVQVGDKYLMIKVESEPNVIYIYPSSKYQLSKKLQDRKVKITEVYPKVNHYAIK